VAPKSASFRHLDKEIMGAIYPIHCGLKQVIMAWTGPEYVYHMLRHHHIQIPEDGLAMLRFFTLDEWHAAHNGYPQLTNQDDRDAQPFIGKFSALSQNAREKCMLDLLDVARDTLWDDGKEAFTDSHGKFPSLTVQETELLCNMLWAMVVKAFSNDWINHGQKSLVIAPDATYNVAEIFKDRHVPPP
jgi:Myo-inositol oxygenase